VSRHAAAAAAAAAAPREWTIETTMPCILGFNHPCKWHALLHVQLSECEEHYSERLPVYNALINDTAAALTRAKALLV
jgi:hypothetical protein